MLGLRQEDTEFWNLYFFRHMCDIYCTELYKMIVTILFVPFAYSFPLVLYSHLVLRFIILLSFPACTQPEAYMPHFRYPLTTNITHLYHLWSEIKDHICI